MWARLGSQSATLVGSDGAGAFGYLIRENVGHEAFFEGTVAAACTVSGINHLLPNKDFVTI
jgi:cyanate permease